MGPIQKVVNPVIVTIVVTVIIAVIITVIVTVIVTCTKWHIVTSTTGQQSLTVDPPWWALRDMSSPGVLPLVTFDIRWC